MIVYPFRTFYPIETQYNDKFHISKWNPSVPAVSVQYNKIITTGYFLFASQQTKILSSNPRPSCGDPNRNISLIVQKNEKNQPLNENLNIIAGNVQIKRPAYSDPWNTVPHPCFLPFLLQTRGEKDVKLFWALPHSEPLEAYQLLIVRKLLQNRPKKAFYNLCTNILWINTILLLLMVRSVEFILVYLFWLRGR